MNATLLKTSVTLVGLICFATLNAAVHYVDVNSANPTPPYTNLATAATVIQDAIDVALPGDEVVVTNGVYETGGYTVFPGMSNRVAVTKPLTVRSVNGPNVTAIRGHPATSGETVRCVYLTNGASLIGFTLTNGYAQSSTPDLGNGGGVWGESTEAYVSNCVFVGNYGTEGGGVFRGTVSDCTFTANGAWEGGGARDAVLTRCIFTENWAAHGGGAYGGILTNCMVISNGAIIGGGVLHAELNNCVLKGNHVASSAGVSYGGGAAYGVLNNCSITDNSAPLGFGIGGGTSFSTLNNCTVTGNSAQQGGGVWGGALNNCILYYNTAFKSSNYGGEFALTINNSCAWPLPPFGTNNIDAEPALASLSHISANSPCRGVGNVAYASGVDIDGEPWSNPPSIGCDEVSSGNDTGPLEVAFTASFTNVAKGFEVNFTARLDGNLEESRWEFGDGTVISNRPYASHAWMAPGDYPVVLRAYNSSNPGGISATTIVHVVEGVHYAAATSTNPSTPFTSWATAATTIQEAIDLALPGAEIIVTNGLYETGGRAVSSGMTNRVAVTKPLTIRSVNGPDVTVIRGNQLPDSVNGSSAIRCVYLTNGAMLIGFTVTGGATRTNEVGPYEDSLGGGVYCVDGFDGAVISNCVITANSAFEGGGGAYGGNLMTCVISNNTAIGGLHPLGSFVYSSGGGAQRATLSNCVVAENSAMMGGGLSECQVINSRIMKNSAAGTTHDGWRVGNGGGSYESDLINCSITGNSAIVEGGGVLFSTLKNCVVVSNSAPHGGGVAGGWAYNSIIYYNSATQSSSNYWVSAPPRYPGSGIVHCSTTPLPTNGIGNIASAPLFVDAASGNFRLQPNSPCINAGRNADAPAAVDLDGNPRIVGGTVDIGAYEFQSPQSIISYAWLQQYGLPINGSEDVADSDGDGHNNWQEWRAGTNPFDAQSALRLFEPVRIPGAVAVSWLSVSNKTYSLERSSNFPSFGTIGTNITGALNAATYADSNAPPFGAVFYRVRVEE